MNKSRLRSSSRHESISGYRNPRVYIYIYINSRGFVENEERKNRDSNFVVARGIRN